MDDKAKTSLAVFNLGLMAYIIIRMILGMRLTWGAFAMQLAIGALLGAVLAGITYAVMGSRRG